MKHRSLTLATAICLLACMAGCGQQPQISAPQNEPPTGNFQTSTADSAAIPSGETQSIPPAENTGRPAGKISAEDALAIVLDNAGVPCALAAEEDFKKEHGDYELTVRVVKDTDEAICIINANNTSHSDGILSEDKAQIEKFVKGVDAACVYVNASTRFTDGFQFGFGAEIGISTQKLHARGPLGLTQLTSEKYVADGDYLSRK